MSSSVFVCYYTYLITHNIRRQKVNGQRFNDSLGGGNEEKKPCSPTYTTTSRCKLFIQQIHVCNLCFTKPCSQKRIIIDVISKLIVALLSRIIYVNKDGVFEFQVRHQYIYMFIKEM